MRCHHCVARSTQAVDALVGLRSGIQRKLVSVADPGSGRDHRLEAANTTAYAQPHSRAQLLLRLNRPGPPPKAAAGPRLRFGLILLLVPISRVALNPARE
jgi:hypothetical protein